MGADAWSVAWTALGVSLKVALCAGALVLLPGLALGLVLARREFPGKSVVETLVALPLALPPTAIGYALLRLFARSGPLGAKRLGFDPDLLLTWKGAVLCAALMALPLVARTARLAFEGVPRRLELMGRSLGMSRVGVLWRVTLPLARRGLLAAALLGFTRALGEFGATVVVAGSIQGETQTLALAIFDQIQVGRDDRALVLLAFSTLLAFTGVLAVKRLLRRRGGGP
jgi:molybdate transport system permease protein